MAYNDDIINRLSEIFTRFPGVGPKQARRFVYFLLGQRQESLEHLASLVTELKKDIHQCELCTRFYLAGRNPAGRLCDLCSDVTRDNGTLMVVEKDIDLNNIRKLGVYGGQYMVLGGLVPILAKDPRDHVREPELLKNIEYRMKEFKLSEIIIALSVTREGDNTVDYLKRLLKPYADQGVKLSTLGRGLSSGTEVEYADSDTIKNALLNRH